MTEVRNLHHYRRLSFHPKGLIYQDEIKTYISADVFSFLGLTALQTPSTFTRRINLFTRDLKLASTQISFNCFQKKFNFSSKTRILINFVELFDLNTPQRLRHSSFVPKNKNKKNQTNKKPKTVFTEI